MIRSKPAKPKRKHRATGTAKGGPRKGAGRPEGSPGVLSYGEVAALKVAGLRVPEGASPEARALADRCQERMIAVMEEKVHFLSARPVLQAATALREEICGSVKKQVEHSFDSLTDEQLEARFQKLVTNRPPGGAGEESAVKTPDDAEPPAPH